MFTMMHLAKSRFSFTIFLIYLFLIVATITMLLPYYWMLITSVKPQGEIQTYPPKFYVQHPTLQPYRDLLNLVPMGRYILNSLYICVTVVLFKVFACTLAGYVFAKHRFWGRDWIFMTFLASLMIPWQVNIIPGFIIVKNLGWINTFSGLIIPTMGWCAFGIFLSRQYIYSIPNDLIDAARIDGCNEWQIYLNVILPLVKPVIATLAIFTFIQEWNNLVWPLVIVNSSAMKTVPLALAVLSSQTSSNFGMLMAGAVMATTPILIVFLMFQRYIIKGVALTGLKG
ncbi:MAG: carbohydrate ABC transporter permease [Candidatus Omnitrophica bacterium]|nr:carbohydrate ABC transporter permease [Candidatus Omnitrophota bacterium]